MDDAPGPIVPGKKYPIAEKFTAPQGEGLLTGVITAFVRLVGCSVGQKICTACDTDFDRTYESLGGGMFTATDLARWARDIQNVCLTGGEPLDRDLRELVEKFTLSRMKVQIETSGTKFPDWLKDPVYRNRIHLTVSPKPGFLPEMILAADEIKVIHGGLGDGPGWPTIEDATRWANRGKKVFLQPRNERNSINRANMDEVINICVENPKLRVSAQLHKFLSTR